MADDTLQIIFGAKVDGLVQGTKQGSAAIEEMVQTIRDQTAALDASAKATASTASSLRAVIPAASSASTGIATIEKAATSAGHGTAGFYRELLVLSHEMAMGNYSRFGGSLMVLAERSGKLEEGFGLLKTAATSIYGPIAAAGIVLGVVALHAEEAAESVAHLSRDAAAVGNSYLFDPSKVEETARALEHAGNSVKDTEGFLATLLRTTGMTSAEFEKITSSAVDIVDKFGSAEAASKALKTAIEDPAAAVRELRGELAANAPDVLNTVQNFIQMGDKAAASRVLIDYLTESTVGLHEKGLTPLAKAWELVKNNALLAYEITAPFAALFIETSKGAAQLATDIKNVAQSLAMMPKVGPTIALNANAVKNSGQTYNMDQNTAYIENQRKLNTELAQTDDIVRKLNNEKTDKLQEQLTQLKTGLADAQTKNDTTRVSTYSTAIAKTEKEIADARVKVQKAADTQELRDWDATLTAELQQRQLFGDQAKAFELQFWQQKKAEATKGSAEYDQINQKIYELENGRYEKGVESAKEAERKKQEATKQTLEQERQAAVAYFDKLAELYKGDEKKYLSIQTDKLKFLQGAYGQQSKQAQDQEGKIAEINRQSLAKQRQNWTGFFSSLKSSFNSSLLGLLQGTQTFGQAVGNIFMSLAESVAGVFEDMAAKAVVAWIVPDQAAATSARGEVASNAAVAGSAAFASTAAIPFIGPAMAPAAAAAAYSGAMSFQAAIPGFAVGAWDLPSDMIAQVHKGEMIIPRTFADDLRSNGGSLGGGGSGDTHHWHISAVDARSIKRLIAGQPDAIAAGLRSAHRNASININAR